MKMFVHTETVPEHSQPIIHHSQKVGATQMLSADEWISTLRRIHTTDPYGAMKGNEVPPPGVGNAQDIKPLDSEG